MAEQVYNGFRYRQAGPGQPWVKVGSASIGTPDPRVPATLNKTIADTDKTRVDTIGSKLDNEKAGQEIITARRHNQQNPISVEDQKYINKQRETVGDMPRLIRDITGAARAVDRFQPAPGRGTMIGAGVPEDNDWLPTVLAKKLYGMTLGDQEKKDYQTITGLQNQQVLNSQIPQKGPQTESDALRMKLANISPNKNVGPNAVILAESQYDAMMAQNRPEFYTRWANRLGSVNAMDKQGRTAGEVWAAEYARGLKRLRADPRYKKVAGDRAPKPKDGWSIERIED